MKGKGRLVKQGESTLGEFFADRLVQRLGEEALAREDSQLAQLIDQNY